MKCNTLGGSHDLLSSFSAKGDCRVELGCSGFLDRLTHFDGGSLISLSWRVYLIKGDGCRTSLSFIVDSYFGVCRTFTLVGALLSELGHCSLPWCHTPSLIALRLHTFKSIIYLARKG